MDLCNRIIPNFSKILFGLIVLTSTACQKSATTGEAASSVDILSCPGGQMKSSGDDMEIQSGGSADVNQSVTFSLNNSALCSGAQKVQWNVPGAAKLVTKAGVASATYPAPGEYVVSAKLSGGDAVADQDLMAKATVMGEQIQFSGPQVTKVFINNTFSLVAPAGITLTNLEWDFGDGQTASSASPSVVHAYRAVGTYVVRVVASDSSGVVTTIEQYITVIPDSDELFCANQLSVSAPSETHVGDNNVLSIFLPSCVRSRLNHVSWDFGDQTSLNGETVNKVYNAIGLYTVKVTVHTTDPTMPTITITRRIQVNDSIVQNNCPTEGQTRVTYSANFDEQESCGINGKKTVTYRNRITETCERGQTILDWVLTNTEKEKVSEGDCLGQACPLPAGTPSGLAGVIVINGQSYLIDGASIEFYTQSNPSNSCEENKVMRSCANGVLSGSTQNLVYQCQSGCGDFGPNGTVKTGIQVGTRQVPVQCQFGEQGIFDLYTEVEDRMCTNGNVNNSNLRLGDLISKGQCPTYGWYSTGQYTSCSADCGGMQSLIYECRDNATGAKVDNARCAGQIQLEKTRVCDGNPDAVRRVESTTENVEETSPNKCPKNQIGIIMRNRDVTTKKTYACIEHKVGLESTVVDYSPWVEEKYCRDYVAYRCNNDSLSNTQAHGRYEWMVKCQDQVPIIKEFLENFDNIKVGNFEIDSTRALYPTFMNRAYSPEKVWKAPTDKSGSCNVPSTVYIAAVCVSSCAIPQEQILAKENAKAQMGPVAFIDALTHKYERVATMTKNSTLSDKKLKSSAVEQWVTELEDTDQPVLVFTMESGKTLSITPNHPLLRKDGAMATAESFKAGDSLVMLGGGLDPIRSIESIMYHGKVYNLFVKSSEPAENVVVTNGYLNGSAYFQNEGAVDMNKSLLRKKLTKGIFNK